MLKLDKKPDDKFTMIHAKNNSTTSSTVVQISDTASTTAKSSRDARNTESLTVFVRSDRIYSSARKTRVKEKSFENEKKMYRETILACANEKLTNNNNNNTIIEDQTPKSFTDLTRLSSLSIDASTQTHGSPIHDHVEMAAIPYESLLDRGSMNTCVNYRNILSGTSQECDTANPTTTNTTTTIPNSTTTTNSTPTITTNYNITNTTTTPDTTNSTIITPPCTITTTNPTTTTSNITPTMITPTSSTVPDEDLKPTPPLSSLPPLSPPPQTMTTTPNTSPPVAPTPPPCPPSFNFNPNGFQTAVKPTKPRVKPSVNMRPLFWKKINIDPSIDENKNSIWHTTKQCDINIVEFEKLFGHKEKSPKKLSRQNKVPCNNTSSANKCLKVLDTNRSRSVAIRLKTMRGGIDDIKNAIYKMHSLQSNKDCTMDAEGLRNLYELRANKSELAKIKQALADNQNAFLDDPEKFLLDISEMSHFSQRVECLCFRKTLLESVFSIDQQLKAIDDACSAIMNNSLFQEILLTVLEFGNHMNGSTSRGQADAFDITTLSKIKDVKSINGCTTLLQHTIRTLHHSNSEQQSKEPSLPDVHILQQASMSSFKDIKQESVALGSQLKAHRLKAEIVYSECEDSLLQPFKDMIEDFFDSAQEMLTVQKRTLQSSEDGYQSLLKYLAQTSSTNNSNDDLSVGELFGEIKAFCDVYSATWKLEDRRIAKETFSKLERTRKERLNAAKRRRSIRVNSNSASPNMTPTSQMKQRCSEIRRECEPKQGQEPRQTLAMFRLARSQSREALFNSQSKIDEIKENSDSRECEPKFRYSSRLLSTHSVPNDSSVQGDHSKTTSTTTLNTSERNICSVHERLIQRRASRIKDFSAMRQQSTPDLLHNTGI